MYCLIHWWEDPGFPQVTLGANTEFPLATDCCGCPKFAIKMPTCLQTLTIYSPSGRTLWQTINGDHLLSKFCLLKRVVCSCEKQVLFWRRIMSISGLHHTFHSFTTAWRVVGLCLQTSWRFLCKLWANLKDFFSTGSYAILCPGSEVRASGTTTTTHRIWRKSKQTTLFHCILVWMPHEDKLSQTSMWCVNLAHFLL